MSKPKNKRVSTQNSGVTNADKPLTEKQLQQVLAFAQDYYNSQTQGYFTNSVNDDTIFPQVFTPQLTNQRLSDIGVSSDGAKGIDVSGLLANLTANQKSLVGYSEFLGLTDAVSKRTTAYLGNLPTFDYTFYCKNITDESEYNSEAYKKDLAIVKEFLSHFDVRGQFSAINRRTLKLDAYYGVFRTDGFDNYVFQELPYDQCLITGKSPDWGFLFDFNMGWFLQQGLSIDQYPPNFKQMWRRTFGTVNDLSEYKPSNPLEKRNGTYALWTQTSPLPKKGNFVCFKFNSDIYGTVPFLTSLFGDVQNKDLVRRLQQNSYIIASQKILVGLIPLLKDQKSGSVRDSFAISAPVLGKFLGLLKQGLNESIKIGGVPFSDVKDISFTLPTTNMYDQYNATTSQNGGVTARFVYTSDKLTAAEVKYNAMIDQMIGEQVYPQYATWLSTMINHMTKKYKFKFVFAGTRFDREERLERAEKLANRGIFIDQLYASAIGKDKFELEALLQMSKHSDFYDLLRLPPNSNTDSLGGGSFDDEPQRARKPVEEVADETARKDDYEGD